MRHPARHLPRLFRWQPLQAGRSVWLGLLAMPLALACGAGDVLDRNDVSVEVRRVALDATTGTPVIILGEAGGERLLPIWIGVAEARSIQSRLERVRPPRPNTHDLAKRLLEGLDGHVERVVVTDLRDRTYYAVIVMDGMNGPVEIDARPSDAIALALRVEAPIFVRHWLFESGKPDADETPKGQPIEWRRPTPRELEGETQLAPHPPRQLPPRATRIRS